MSTMTTDSALSEPHVPRYTLAQRLLHWVVALLVAGSLLTGLTIGFLGFDGLSQGFGMDITNFFYTSHKTLGVLILGLMLLRAVLRLRNGKPAYATPLPNAQRIVSTIVHGLLYVLLLTMPVLGWLATASGGFPVQFFGYELPGLIKENQSLSDTLFQWHATVGWTLLALIALHVSGALYHWLIRRDNVMKRMRLF